MNQRRVGKNPSTSWMQSARGIVNKCQANRTALTLR